VEDNQAFYTHRQFERAKRALNLYHALWTPSIPDFKAILRINMIANNPVTTEGLILAGNSFGPNIET
jgi:hypothetical protein